MTILEILQKDKRETYQNMILAGEQGNWKVHNDSWVLYVYLDDLTKRLESEKVQDLQKTISTL